MTNIQEIFGCQVFNETVMQSRLPKDTYRSLIKTIKDGKTLDIDTANVIANAMKDWAIEKGATHFTHWFQPMTDVTAEKHDSFITPVSGGKVMLEFSGTLPGTPHHLHLLKMIHYVFLPLSVLTVVNLLTRKPLFFAQWKLWTNRL